MSDGLTTLEMLEEAIASRLPEARAFLDAAHELGLTDAQIAVRTGMTVETVRAIGLVVGDR
jgi:DNA-directed RNA polymerase specialized sigma24 family protein